MTDVFEFSFSKWSGRVLMVSSMFVALIGIAFIVSGTYGVVKIRDPFVKAGCVVLVVMGTKFLLDLWFIVKHRYVLESRYEVGSTGINVVSPKGSVLVPWDQLVGVDTLPHLAAYRLVQRDSSEMPIVLFFHRTWWPNRAHQDQHRAVKKLVAAKMGEHMQVRWFP